jgi:hypothetical protein
VASKTILAFNGHTLSAEDDLAPVPLILALVIGEEE